MTIGAGIFLSSLVMALLLLFLRTRDRWNWKRIILWTAAMLVGVPAVLAITFYANDKWRNSPERQTVLWGIRLTDAERDVKFKKGLPTAAEGNSDRELWVYALDDENTVLPEIKASETPAHMYLVRFSKHHVRWVICAVGPLPIVPNLSGITPDSSLDDLEKKLGKPTYISRSADETERWFSFDQYNIAFAFKGGRMSGVALYDSSIGPIKFKEEGK